MNNCRKCGTELITQYMRKVPKLKRVYFFTQWNYCTNCSVQYFDQKYALTMNARNLEYAKSLVQQERLRAELLRASNKNVEELF